MAYLGALLALLVLAVTLLDGFETIILPRRVSRLLRPSRLYYRGAWTLWRLVAGRLPHGKRRDYFMSVFGPLSLLTLFALWAFVLVSAFALLYYSLGVTLKQGSNEETPDYVTFFYMSGVTFFTLGFGDVTAGGTAGRLLTVAEASLGFGFLAVVIGYLPVLYQAFSKREAADLLAAGRPSRFAPLRRRGAAAAAEARGGNLGATGPLLVEWERWAAELLEATCSFPVLAFYRSQHDNQSWLAALTAMLDSCSLLLTSVSGADRYQARLTFAMARHAAVDLALSFQIRPLFPRPDRLSAETLTALLEELRKARSPECAARAASVEAKLGELRAGCMNRLSVVWRRSWTCPCQWWCPRSQAWITGRLAPGCAAPPASASCRRPTRTMTTLIDPVSPRASGEPHAAALR